VGRVDPVAVFGGLPSPMANPTRDGAQEADPVPTCIAFDQAGTAYASFLSGVPFSPGAAKVMTVPADGTASDYATSLTTLTDLQTGPDGNLYAVQFGRFAQESPEPNSGASAGARLCIWARPAEPSAMEARIRTIFCRARATFEVGWATKNGSF
jgi:hypothetical protein